MKTVRHAALLLVLLLPSLLALPQPDETGPRVTVGCWNLEWLGTPGQRSGVAPRTEEDLRAIAATIGDILDIEVIVLVEINTNSTEWVTLKESLSARGFKFIEGSGGQQRVVVTYDDDELDLLSSPDSAEPDLPTSFSRPDTDGTGVCTTSNARKPVFATFRAQQFDFTVIGVHLKSGLVPQGCSDESFPEFVRGEQAKHILEEIARRQQAGAIDTDIIVVGDYNGGLEDASLKKLRAGGFRVVTEEANRSSSSGALSFRKGSFLSQLDHIAIRPVTDREWVPRSTMYLPAITTMTADELTKFRQRFSDHGPAWTEFRAAGPDDD